MGYRALCTWPAKNLLPFGGRPVGVVSLCKSCDPHPTVSKGRGFCTCDQGGKRRMLTAVQRRFPVGAEPVAGGVHFRVWAPRRNQVEVVLEGSPAVPLESECDGYVSAAVEFAR